MTKYIETEHVFKILLVSLYNLVALLEKERYQMSR